MTLANLHETIICVGLMLLSAGIGCVLIGMIIAIWRGM